MKGYYMPEPNLQEGVYKIDQCAFSKKDKADHPIDIEVKQHAWVPGAKYNPYPDWCVLPKFAPTTTKNRGKFARGPKKTTTEEILAFEKKKNSPPPNAYKI